MTPGTRIGDFEVLGRLGAGGMGEVYRARDTRLGREVAIKILPDVLRADPDRLARLEREARLLASLNHPNIAAIYAVDAAGPVHALVLELVEGETLGTRIRRGRLSLADTRAIARQIVAALDAAHGCGIVHRDLKPDNVMLGPRTVVKVLDFGIAKPVPAAASLETTASAAFTAHGEIVGTAAYMSPEQARGLPVDRRADIWAFGCVLYEMLSGRRAFGGTTLSDSIAATLEKEPDWQALPPATPVSIRRLLAYALQKDPHDRLRDIADSLPYLDDAPAAEQTKARRLRPAIPWAIASVALALGAWAWLAAERGEPDRISRQVMRPLTREAGLTTDPALSRDGRLLAYASDRAGGGTLDIWVQQVAGGTPIRLTDDVADDTAPDFSPDGSEVLFQSERDGGGAYIVSAFGGATPRLVARGARQPRFSPDGSEIAYWTGAWRGPISGSSSGLYVVSLKGGAPRRLAAGFRAIRAPVWAPDGRSLVFVGRADTDSPLAESLDWWWVTLDDSTPVKVGLFENGEFRQAQAAPSAWSADGVLFSNAQDVWSVGISSTNGRISSPPQRLTISTGTYISPATDGRGNIVFASTQDTRIIERASFDASSSPRPPVQLYSDFAADTGRPSENADGSIVVFERPAASGTELWTRNLRTRAEQLVARVDGTTDASATISPDGTRIGYTVVDGSGVGGKGFVVEAARGVPSPVCEGCVVGGFLSDSRRLLLSKGEAIRVHDVVSGTAVDAVVEPGARLNRPHASPDDRWIAFRVNIDGGGKIFVAQLTPGQPRRRGEWMAIEEPTTSGRPAGWSLDGRTAYLLLDTDGFRCLWGQRIATGHLDGTPVPVRHFHGADWATMSTSFGNAVSPDGFLYSIIRKRGNIWMINRR